MAEVTAAPMDISSSPEAAASTNISSSVTPSMAPSDPIMRRLSMSSSAAGDDDRDDDDQEGLPSVYDLLQAVAQLQGVVREIGPNDGDAAALFDDDELPFTIYRSPSRGPRYYVDPRSTLKYHVSAPNLAQGIYDPRKRGTSVVSALSPQKDPVFHRTDAYGGSGLITPPPKRRELSSVPRPTTRVAALTRENISLLPTPQDYARRRNTAGSISGMSQQSKTSVRTDGGAVFSRLYQSDYHKNRDQKLRAIRDRQENLNLSFAPRTNNAQRTSISSRDSVGSSSIGSMQSAKTDITGVSSRLYDPDYVRKRNARLNRMREERELRNCTFAPAINTASAATLNPANDSGAATPNRRASSIHLNLKS
ncbi:Dihydrolipoyllysine-residue succinyltransferase component of 2-oxoglutarate dehydrogenase complex [Globisporangium polare]